ncbi:MAG: hypothetical protein IJ889_06695 [Eubacterium sp.]|nr:hypothetical protein [Eubacterium sp.]
MKEFFKSGKNIAILVLAIVLAGSVACNICLATRRCAPRGPKGNDKQIEKFHGQQGGPQGQAPQGNDNQQGQPPQGQPPQGQPPQGQQPNAQAPQDGQNSQKKDSDKKGNNDDKKDNDDDDDDEKAKAQ